VTIRGASATARQQKKTVEVAPPLWDAPGVLAGDRFAAKRLRPLLALGATLLAACNRQQSALSPFGEEADAIRTMTAVLVAGATVIALAVAALGWRATHAPDGEMTQERGMRLILWGGAIVPTVVLTALLLFALPAMRPRPVAAGDLRIRATGEQFWWRVDYRLPGQAPVTSANEVRVPVGRTVLFELVGGDVIHSFWIPGLAGKMDMIPGRLNRLPVRATRAGRFRGQCTEFCGLGHALMAFDVVAMEPAAFDRWLAAERGPARAVEAPGRALFAAYGCGGCHAVRGEGHAGTIGPDLTRMGARATLAAGMLPPREDVLARWIRHPEAFKPGVRMPAYPHMPDGDAVAIARWLRGLR
jgi:cytochrome c oxidase subunit II